MVRRNIWLPVTTAVVLVALAMMAHVQWSWIDALSKAREEHERHVLDFAARQFAGEFDGDVASILSAMERSRPDNAFRIARDPHLIAGLFVAHEGGVDQVTADGTHHPVDWPAALAPVRARIEGGLRGRGPFEPTVPAIVLPMAMHRMPEPGAPIPLFVHHPPVVVVQLDRAYITQRLFPDIARRLGPDYDVAVSDGQRVIYQSNRAWNGTRAETTVPLLHESGWTLSIRNHDGTVAELVARGRWRNQRAIIHVMALQVIGLALLVIMARRADRLRQRQLEFVAGMTHELNTPLAALQSAGQNLADGVVHDDAQVARYGTMVARESRRLADLVAQVLDYSGLQRRAKLARAPVDVASVIANAVDATRWLAEEKQVEVETSVADDLPRVDGDADTLTRAVQNLIANAIRHGGEGRWARVSATRGDDHVAITVEDRGPGIAPGDASHLFEPFYRGRGATTRGTGLGLTIVSQIARAHGGKISFDRHRERGAAFTLTLPVVKHG